MACLTICNICGKTVSHLYFAPLSISTRISFPSKYDGAEFNLFCCEDCADRFLDAVDEMCAVSPIEGGDDGNNENYPYIEREEGGGSDIRM